MATVFLDDRFSEHPKVVAAGEAAGWMFVGGLCYAARHGYQPVIPKEMASRFTGARNAATLARKLVSVGLWHDRGDHFEIHDYAFWNDSAIQRSAKAKKAARARWGHARAAAEHMPEQRPSTCPDSDRAHAPAMPHARPTASASASAVDVGVFDPLSSSSSARASDDDDRTNRTPPEPPPPPGDVTTWEQTGLVALQRLAQRDLERREAQRGPVGDELAWLRSATERRGNQHQAQLAGTDLGTYVGRVDALVDLLEPARPAVAGKTDGPLAGSLGTILGRLRAEERAAECGRCDNGSIETDTGWIRCECQAQR